jgi:hypothetical protein
MSANSQGEFYQEGDMIWSSPPPLSFEASDSAQASAAPQEDCVIPANKELRIQNMSTTEICCVSQEPCLLPGYKELRLDDADTMATATQQQANVIRSHGELVIEATPTTKTEINCAELRLDTPHDIQLPGAQQDLVMSRPSETNTSTCVAAANLKTQTPGGKGNLQGQPCMVRNAPPVRQNLKEAAHIIHASWQDVGVPCTHR